MHGFRSFDLSFAQAMVLSTVKQAKETSQAYAEIAKMWLRRSQDFRHASLFLSFSCANMLVSTVLIALSFTSDYLFGGWLYVPFLATGVLFLALMLVGQLIRYEYLVDSRSNCIRNFASSYIKISWRLSMFPPLLPPLKPTHIARWPEIQGLIDRDENIAKYVQELPPTRYLSMVPNKWPER